ncbi:biotin biosynthesis protein BioC [Fictibacillus macauensis ZFHKF-1]|uniref:Malonyl-[acyl-carrier protein] O-methyltransferase n=1 Tax=Fictibacillus macauensis ZFHKF-1 TaxID=1196324 RepID=I8ANG6_9BACL|nr:malonyl-ACP O-methyltransferase BioC [Fictibacillus macauensis]EIT87354.1 biotin biosynthesis protein BioC [Fictibacillus macauensis ZFHKF-1]
MINKTLVQKRFSKQATSYDEYAIVQKQMADHLLAQLTCHSFPKNVSILEIGCGTGFLTEKLCAAFPHAGIVAVDLAPGMIQQAKTRFLHSGVTFQCGDIERMNFSTSFDIIVSNATFQWFNHVDQTLQMLMNAVKPTGMLAFSTFGEKTFHEMHTSYEAVNASLDEESSPPSQRFLSYAELETLCQNVKQGSYKLRESFAVEQFSSVRDFLRSLQKIGATNSNERSMSPGALKSMMRHYEERFTDQNAIEATYHCLFAFLTRAT